MARNNKTIGIIVGACLLIGIIVGGIIWLNSGDVKALPVVDKVKEGE